MPVQPAVLNSNATLYVQVFGCGTQPKLIDCAMIEDDITIAVSGDVESVYRLCGGKFEEIAEIDSPPDRGEISVMVHLQRGEPNYLDTLVDRGSCNFPLYILFHCPVKGLWNDYSHVLKLEKARIISHAINNPLGGEDKSVIDRIYTISYSSSDASFLYTPAPVLTPLAGGDTTDLRDVAYLQDETNCIGDCVDELEACSTGYTAGDGDGVTNGTGVFGVDETCTSWAQEGSFYVGPGTTNVLSMVASNFGPTPRLIMATNVATEVYYSDGLEPTAATQVTIAGAGGAATGPNSLYLRDDGTIFFVTSAGWVLLSEDNGLTWEAATGAAIGTNFNAITFSDELNGLAGGDSGELWQTNNGGLSWFQLTAVSNITDDIVAIKVGGDRYYILTETGTAPSKTIGLFTKKITDSNLDEDWTDLSGRQPISANTTDVMDMDFKGCNGVIVYNNASGSNVGRVSWTVNGGYDWSSGDDKVVPNTGYNAVYLRKSLEATIVGNGGTVVGLTGLAVF